MLIYFNFIDLFSDLFGILFAWKFIFINFNTSLSPSDILTMAVLSVVVGPWVTFIWFWYMFCLHIFAFAAL